MALVCLVDRRGRLILNQNQSVENTISRRVAEAFIFNLNKVQVAKLIVLTTISPPKQVLNGYAPLKHSPNGDLLLAATNHRGL